MKEKLNIAVFTDSFFPSGGGTEVATYQLCKALQEQGHNILLFAPNYHREQSFNEFEVIRVKSIPLTQNDMMVFPSLQFKNLLARTKQFEPDIVYFCTASGMAKLAIKIAKKLNKPLVATIHTKFKESFYDGSKSHLITQCLLHSLVLKLYKADKVISVSKDMAGELHNYGFAGEVEVIKNGIDHIKPNAQNIINKTIEGTVNFLFCGHLIKVKNIQFSLKALGLLKREKGFDDFKFYIVGQGGYKKKLEKTIKKENLQDNVIFTGYIKDRQELVNMYSKAHLFLFPSVFDTDGLVVCEAAQIGTPTLTLKNYGASERLTDNKNGFISEYDLRKFAERIYEIVNDKATYQYVCKNVRTILGESWQEIARKYEKIFKEVIDNK